MIWVCVGFASRPFSAMARHISHASRPFCGSVMTALSRPFPRTDLKNGDCIADISSRNILPSLSAFSVRCSSRITSRAATATFAAKGKPPNVEPCSPGFMVSMISSSARTAEMGSTPPDSALPIVIMSGRMPSWSHANMRPVRPMPVCTSSATKSTLCFLQRS